MSSSGATCSDNLVVGSPEMTVATAARVMRNQHAIDRLKASGVRHIPIMDAEGKPAGLVSIEDLVGSAVPWQRN